MWWYARRRSQEGKGRLAFAYLATHHHPVIGMNTRTSSGAITCPTPGTAISRARLQGSGLALRVGFGEEILSAASSLIVAWTTRSGTPSGVGSPDVPSCFHLPPQLPPSPRVQARSSGA